MRKTISTILLSFILFMIPPSAYAERSALDEIKARNIDLFSDNAWNEYIDVLFEINEVDPNNIAFGYYNATTEEEYYFNGDEYFIAASMYKVPLNMVYAEMVSNGEITMDTKINGNKYSDLQYSTIVDSSNDKAEVLWENLGGYMGYKHKSAKFLTDEPDDLPGIYYLNNYFTTKQFIYCMKELINNPDKYPGVIECMLEAGQGVHFKRDVSWCDIASKMGYVVEEGYHSVYTDTAIVYAEETFAIVMFTDNLNNPCDTLADYCTLMCDYTNSRSYVNAQKQEISLRIENTFDSIAKTS